jgi:hypothetical protein
MATHIGQPTRSRRFIKAYLTTWALLAVGALAYLAVLAFQLPAVPPRPQVADPDPNQGVRAMTKALAEMGTMRRSLSDVQKDVGQLRETVGEREAQDKAVQSRLTVLEERVATIDTSQAAAVTTLKVKPADKTARKAPEPRATPRTIVVPQSEAAPLPGPPLPGPRADGPPVPLETGSITPTEEITFGEPVVTPAGSAIFAVQLAAGASLQGLRKNWSELVERHGLLATLQPRVVSPRTGGGSYRLLAGPLQTKADADRVCTEMGLGRNGCFATAYAGAPLP